MQGLYTSFRGEVISGVPTPSENQEAIIMSIASYMYSYNYLIASFLLSHSDFIAIAIVHTGYNYSMTYRFYINYYCMFIACYLAF